MKLGYRVDDFGTEEKVPSDTSVNVSAPISYDVHILWMPSILWEDCLIIMSVYQ